MPASSTNGEHCAASPIPWTAVAILARQLQSTRLQASLSAGGPKHDSAPGRDGPTISELARPAPAMFTFGVGLDLHEPVRCNTWAILSAYCHSPDAYRLPLSTSLSPRCSKSVAHRSRGRWVWWSLFLGTAGPESASISLNHILTLNKNKGRLLIGGGGNPDLANSCQ